MAKNKDRARRAWAGLCLAALTLALGTPLLAAEAGKAPSIEADAQRSEQDFASLGGALYNPFSPTFETAAKMPSVASPARQQANDESFGLAATTLAAFFAAGALVVLVRLLVAG
ncbi:hypothetical protein C7T35_28560 [Variovorax sp. WS11]|uniref:hypothetical protein n=1 Tax=Variovorax sp. WS11 TaxID=1105204 RepID=UPI000D0DF816|nr:hypothetical protein [Variovorax sp. WS11]NDZ13559.1 hypothetical protein [Variovorax sp. WS11]PSL81129.1 hypothetical protein C7T35_28560 [Variovorax sp. WS11]